MEALGAAASIVAVLQLSAKIVKYVNGVKNASSELAGILLELSALRGILTSLTEVGNQEKEAWISNDILPSLQVVLSELDVMLAPFQPTGKVLMKTRNKLLWPFKDGEFKGKLETIERIKSLFGLALQTDHFNEVQSKMEHIRVTTEEIHARQAETKKREILQWLSPIDVSTNHNVACKKREPSTGNWFLDLDEYITWKNTPGGMIWVHGIHVKAHQALGSGDIGVAYYYFDFNSKDSGDVSNVLRSLIAQLAGKKQKLPEAVTDMYDHYCQSRELPDQPRLLSVLSSLISGFEDCFVIIDALDECAAQGSREDMLNMLTAIKTGLPAANHLHLLTFSRKEADIENAVAPLTAAAISLDTDKVDMDIQLFRWVACQLDILKQCRTERKLKMALEEMPKTIYDIYDRIVDNIDPGYRDEAKTAFQWLAVSQRPLYLEELAEAAFLDPEKGLEAENKLWNADFILEVCSSLVTTVTKVAGTTTRVEVKFAHSSVKEYFLATKTRQRKQSEFSMTESQAQELVARQCLMYLDMLNDWESVTKTQLDEFPLMRFAAKYWPNHVQRARDTNKAVLPASVEKLVLDILGPDDPPAFRNWLSIYDPDHEWREDEIETNLVNVPSPIYYAASLGLLEVVQMLLDEGADANDRGGVHGSPLQAAVWKANLAIVELLLDNDADVAAEGGQHGSAIHIASLRGNLDIVKTLLDHEAQPTNRSGRFGSALHAAAEGGQLAVVKLLLSRPDVDPNLPDDLGRTPLWLAAQSGHADVVQLLLESKGVDADSLDNKRYTPIWCAAQNGHSKVVEILLRFDVMPDRQDPPGRTPLSFAAQSGHDEVVRLLLGRKDVNPDLGDECNITPLTRAAQSGHIAIVKMLLEKGVNPDPKAMYGETPIAGAARHGHVSVMKLLLERDLDLEWKDAYGRTALDFAVATGKKDAIDLLKGSSDDSAEEGPSDIPAEDPPPYSKVETTVQVVEKEIIDEKGTTNGPPNLAAVALRDDLQFLFYQEDNSTTIKKVRWDGKWASAEDPEVVLETARASSPIAVTGWEWDSVIHMRLYYLDSQNYLREHAYTSTNGWAPGPLNAMNVSVPPYSQLATTSWDDRTIHVFYQSDDLYIREMCGWTDKEGHAHWQFGGKIAAAAPGSSIGVVNWKRSTRTNLRLYFEGEDHLLKEKCWEGLWDGNFGYYQRKITPGAPITAIAWGSLGTENSDYEGLYMRVYTLDASGDVIEMPWRYGWGQARVVAKSVPGSKLAVVQMGSSDDELQIRAMCSGDKSKVNEFVCCRGDWIDGEVTETNLALSLEC
ncbi:Inversin [Dactylella cylindrospora]|nr:Inversin [Dactylella cylindrospora]